MKGFIYDTYNSFREKNPWVRQEGVRPKSIAREMYEGYMDFEDYIKDYKLERSEAILLRHISEVYKVLSQSIPPHFKDETLIEAEEYLKDHVSSVDSSLIDEWELLKNPDYLKEKESQKEESKKRPLTQQGNKFEKLVREVSLNALKDLAYDNIEQFLTFFEANSSDGNVWNFKRIDPDIDRYFDTHHSIRLDPEARNTKHTQIDKSHSSSSWKVSQIICDPDEKNDWAISFIVKLPESDIQEKPVLTLESFCEI